MASSAPQPSHRICAASAALQRRKKQKSLKGLTVGIRNPSMPLRGILQLTLTNGPFCRAGIGCKRRGASLDSVLFFLCESPFVDDQSMLVDVSQYMIVSPLLGLHTLVPAPAWRRGQEVLPVATRSTRRYNRGDLVHRGSLCFAFHRSFPPYTSFRLLVSSICRSRSLLRSFPPRSYHLARCVRKDHRRVEASLSTAHPH